MWTFKYGSAARTFSIKTPGPSGMTGLVVKTRTACSRSWQLFLNAVKKYFNLERASFYKSQ